MEANQLIDQVKIFIAQLEVVFDKDWQYSKTMLNVREETEKQRKALKEMGLESIYMIDPNGTFLNPEVEDETENWGHRGKLLDLYRKLKSTLQSLENE